MLAKAKLLLEITHIFVIYDVSKPRRNQNVTISLACIAFANDIFYYKHDLHYHLINNTFSTFS